MTGYDKKRLDGRNKKKQYNYTAVRIYEYAAAAVPVRTQGGKTSLAGVTCTAVQQ